ncbi:hypothetical protein [Umezawaea sp.]|uniref:hypothetical protein n=1 Tax=Umezawaea sp. TaxID=1955258 RepID=UPI002ED36745
MRKTTAAFAVALAIAGVTVFSASPAGAITNCSSYFIDTPRVGARCTSSAGALSTVMAIAYCRRDLVPQKVVYGRSVRVHETSVADCGAGWYAANHGYALGS